MWWTWQLVGWIAEQWWRSTVQRSCEAGTSALPENDTVSPTA
jgi:hypothetical protein